MKVLILVSALAACWADEGGVYVPDNSGQYVPSDEGRYYPDNSGQYIPDDSGRYLHDGSGAYNERNGLIGSGTILRPQINPLPPKPTTYQTSDYVNGRWKIIRQLSDSDTDGYHWEYETENKILAEESGKLANKGTDAEALRAKGFYQYTGPDNVVYSVVYTADENGFVPTGDHLPTPPPIPAAILKSLEFNKV